MANIFEMIKRIENLDHLYNNKSINQDTFLRDKGKNLIDFQSKVNSIGIDNCLIKLYGIKYGYSESAFGHILSKMYNKIVPGEGVSALTEAFQSLSQKIITTKGWGFFFDSIDQVINSKIAEKGHNDQANYIKYEFYKKGWLSVTSHQNQEELADQMFSFLLAHKSGHELPPIPSKIDLASLKNSLNEYEQIFSNRPEEVVRVKRIKDIILEKEKAQNVQESREDSSKNLEGSSGKLTQKADNSTADVPSNFKGILEKVKKAVQEDNRQEFYKAVVPFCIEHKNDSQIKVLKDMFYQQTSDPQQVARAELFFNNVDEAVKILGDD